MMSMRFLIMETHLGTMERTGVEWERLVCFPIFPVTLG